MRLSVLGSGSRGNSVYIESGQTGLLIDAGFSGKEIEKRLKSIGRDLSNVSALCITHEHGDHIQGAGVLSRRCKLPVYINGGTLAAGEKRMGKLFEYREFETGDILTVGNLQLRSFRVSHDTEDPVGYVVSNGKRSVGYCTDTGKTSFLASQRLAGCNALILEFNHDLEMLKNGPYPLPLQQRVRSSRGHLSNEDGATFLADLIGKQLDYAILAHLSETNNRPEFARQAALNAVEREKWQETELLIAAQDEAGPLLEL